MEPLLLTASAFFTSHRLNSWFTPECSLSAQTAETNTAPPSAQHHVQALSGLLRARHTLSSIHTHTHRDISGNHMESHTCTELLLSSLRASDACWDSSFNYRLPTYGCQSLLLYISNIIVLLYII